MTNPPPLTGPFAQALKDNRAVFNARFVETRRTQPRLDPDEFSDLLRTTVAAIVASAVAARPDLSTEVVNALYDLSLDLLARELIGPRSHYPYISAGWRDLLPALGPHIAESPRGVAGSITNALYNLSVEPAARPQEWLDNVRALAPLCPGIPELLQIGQIAAWRAGLAHYRQGALALCRRLPTPLALAALGLFPDSSGAPTSQQVTLPGADHHAAGPVPTSGQPQPAGAPVARATEPSAGAPVAGPIELSAADLATLLDRLAADPWLHPSDALGAARPRQLRIVARAGAFRGFGGLFMAPPLVSALGDHFVARDGDSRWLLTADRFGATFHRAAAAPAAIGSGSFQLDRSGKVTLGKDTRVFPELAAFTSVAANDRTLAVTTPLTHAIYLVALA